MLQSNKSVSARIQEVMEQERRQAAEERQQLLAQIAALIGTQADLQEKRLAGKAADIERCMLESNTAFEGNVVEYSTGMDAWGVKDAQLLEDISQSKATLKKKLQDDWSVSCY
jgi:kinesin family protein 11